MAPYCQEYISLALKHSCAAIVLHPLAISWLYAALMCTAFVRASTYDCLPSPFPQTI